MLGNGARRELLANKSRKPEDPEELVGASRLILDLALNLYPSSREKRTQGDIFMGY